LHNEVYREYAETKAYADAQEEFRKECLGAATVEEVVSCFRSAIQAAREPQRAEEDLDAQKKMAQWAQATFFLTLCIGVTTIFVGMLGIIWIRNTLIADHRAWLAPKAVIIASPYQRKGNVCSIQINCRFINTGKTPAKQVALYAQLLIFPPNDPGRAFLDLESKIRLGSLSFGYTIFPNDDIIWPVSAEIKTTDIDDAVEWINENSIVISEPIAEPDPTAENVPIDLVLIIYADYHLVFKGERRRTGQIFKVCARDSAGRKRFMYATETHIPADQLYLERWLLGAIIAD
jgi:hypothetical protein